MHWNDSEPGVARTMNRKKKTGKWCKGKVGVQHVTEIVVNHNFSKTRPCGWFPTSFRWDDAVMVVTSHRWRCIHSSKCVNCGKYVEYFLADPEQCPDYKPREES